jgi:hypothetical protein
VNYASLPYQNIHRPIWPIDRDMSHVWRSI